MPDVNCRDKHENDSIKTEVRWTLSQQKIRFWFFDFQNWIWPLFWDFFISSSFNRTLFQISKWKHFWESRLSQVTQSLFLRVSIRNDSGLQERAADSCVGLYCPIRKFGEWEEIKNTRFLMNKGERLTSYLRLGALLVRDKKYDRAEALYKSCIVEFEDDFRCYFNYAQLRCVQKRYWEAEQLFLEAETRWHGAKCSLFAWSYLFNISWQVPQLTSQEPGWSDHIQCSFRSATDTRTAFKSSQILRESKKRTLLPE
jgi:tetratricopeptide (TPR) repeat protein